MRKAAFLVSTSNRPALLAACLKHLAQQRGIPRGWTVEVLVIGAPDDPGRYSVASIPNARYVEVDSQVIGEKLNTAVATTDAELLMVADDDDLQPSTRAKLAIKAHEAGAGWSAGLECVYYDLDNDRAAKWDTAEDVKDSVLGTTFSVARTSLVPLGGWPKLERNLHSTLARKLRAKTEAGFKAISSSGLVCLHHGANIHRQKKWPAKGETVRFGHFDVTGLGSLAEGAKALSQSARASIRAIRAVPTQATEEVEIADGDWLRTRNMKWALWGIRTQQVPSALFWMDYIVQKFGVGAVVEVGTACGGTAAWFGNLLPGRVATMDIKDKRSALAKGLHKRLGVLFVKRDFWADSKRPRKFTNYGKGKAGGKPLLVFCDGGNKVKEWGVMAPLLRPGDLIMAHDNPKEFPADSLGVKAQVLRLDRLLRTQLDKDGTMLALYRKY